ncbi:MAG: hypothetical protein P8M12_02135 [Flavobacteriales bacterium]|nr:hypothetical protein [Flavobacteriales bacterium]
MKKITLSLLICSLFIGVTMLSCGKYEEGPGFSLLPKKTRLQQRWKPVEYISANGTVTSIDNDGSYIEFVKGGSFQFYDYASMSPFGLDALTGDWEFSDDKTQLITSYSVIGQTFSDTYTIVKLKINSLGLMDSNENKTYYEYK